LQIAVDDEDEVVELFSSGQRDGTQRLRLVGLAVAEKCPDLRVRLRLQSAVLEIAHEPRLVDGHQWTEAHRHGGILPEVWHQPGMRVRGEPAARLHLAAEVLEMGFVDASFEISARVDARRRVALEVDDVRAIAGGILSMTAKE